MVAINYPALDGGWRKKRWSLFRFQGQFMTTNLRRELLNRCEELIRVYGDDAILYLNSDDADEALVTPEAIQIDRRRVGADVQQTFLEIPALAAWKRLNVEDG